jgi:hypothetical protein
MTVKVHIRPVIIRPKLIRATNAILRQLRIGSIQLGSLYSITLD